MAVEEEPFFNFSAVIPVFQNFIAEILKQCVTHMLLL